MAIVLLHDESDDHGPYPFAAPDGMELAAASALLGRLVDQVKEARPMEYEWSDLLAAVTPVGFRELKLGDDYLHCGIDW